MGIGSGGLDVPGGGASLSSLTSQAIAAGVSGSQTIAPVAGALITQIDHTLTGATSYTVNTSAFVPGQSIELTLHGPFSYSFTNNFLSNNSTVITPQCSAVTRDKISLTVDQDGSLLIRPIGQAQGNISSASAPTVGTATATPLSGAIQINMTGAIANNAPISGYTIGRALGSGGPYTTVATNVALPYNDAGLTNGTAYFYVVQAVNGQGNSGQSAEVNATPALFTPNAAGAAFTWDTTNTTTSPDDGTGHAQFVYDTTSSAKYMGQTSTTTNVRPSYITTGGGNGTSRVLSFTSAVSVMSSVLGSGSNVGSIVSAANLSAAPFYFCFSGSYATVAAVTRMLGLQTTDGKVQGFSFRHDAASPATTGISLIYGPSNTNQTCTEPVQDTSFHVFEIYSKGGGVIYYSRDGVLQAVTSITGAGGFSPTALIWGGGATSTAGQIVAAFTGTLGPGCIVPSSCPAPAVQSQFRQFIAGLTGTSTQ